MGPPPIGDLRLCGAPLNNGERQFEQKGLGPQRVFELQFTAPETTPRGIVFWLDIEGRILYYGLME